VDNGLPCGQPFQLAAALVLEVVEVVDDPVSEEEEDDDDDPAAARGLSDEGFPFESAGLPFDSLDFAAARLSVR
jgi:hypothetical protein